MNVCSFLARNFQVKTRFMKFPPKYSEDVVHSKKYTTNEAIIFIVMNIEDLAYVIGVSAARCCMNASSVPYNCLPDLITCPVY